MSFTSPPNNLPVRLSGSPYGSCFSSDPYKDSNHKAVLKMSSENRKQKHNNTELDKDELLKLRVNTKRWQQWNMNWNTNRIKQNNSESNPSDNVCVQHNPRPRVQEIQKQIL